jgi:hypothetical protein
MRNMISTVCCALAGVCLAMTVAQAQEPAPEGLPFDPVEVDFSNAPTAICYMSARYIVVERQRKERIGSDFFVRPRESNRCEADSLPGDYVLRDEWAAYFSALRGDVLFIDSGSGPDIRYLILVDLVTRRRLTELSYVELVPGPDLTVVGLWDGYELEEPLPDCPAPSGGLVPGVDSLFFLDVRSGQTRFSGRTRCAQRQ